ncbi:MAG: hypothetical protein M0R66_04010 [Candidatus Omnitrophica bacterium]|nr:hypothetical protein [Candidatus Omnitrophota bacterium]
MKKRFSILIFVILAASVGFWYFSMSQKKYSLSEYFPLNENDKYTYNHHEGGEERIVTITVKDVQKTNEGKQFNFLWEGKYNDRIQALSLSARGIFLRRNEHLVGEFPMRSIRTCVPPMVMIPPKLENITLAPINYWTYDLKGDLREKEKIEESISFAGFEDVNVEAGKFKCIHFFERHNYKDELNNSKHMHIYDFWIAPNVGIVKFVHAFIPFMYMRYISPDKKTIMNRYSGFFVEIFELKKADIGGKVIGAK